MVVASVGELHRTAGEGEGEGGGYCGFGADGGGVWHDQWWWWCWDGRYRKECKTGVEVGCNIWRVDLPIMLRFDLNWQDARPCGKLLGVRHWGGGHEWIGRLLWDSVGAERGGRAASSYLPGRMPALHPGEDQSQHLGQKEMWQW